MNYVNPNKIIKADVLEPSENCGPMYGPKFSRGWQLRLYMDDNFIVVNCQNEQHKEHLK